MTRTPTPLVARLAAQNRIDLAAVKATGAGGRITARDVRRAAPPRAAVAARSRPRLEISMRSAWTRANSTVSVDVYSANPLLDDLQLTDPDRLAAARQRDPQVPTLFATGDLPMFCASGLDPALLLQLPYVARHRASTASATEAAEMFERYGAATQTTWDAALIDCCLDGGNLAYENRMLNWGTDA